ncbi:MAG: 4Fe-4S binding protein [Deltaproteobacteria bacterium]|nr:4Fe-4S binding protein [Deltaproteobacteria bacterium]
MGHMGQLKQEYRGLMERLDHLPVGMPRPEDERALEGWRELLEVMYSPEEAALASRMPMMPTPLSKLAGRFDMPEQELREKLEPLCDKGLVMDLVSRSTGETKYLLAPPVIGFFEFSMMRAHDMFDKLSVAKAMDAYVHGDDTFAREVFGNDTVIGRAMVHEDVLAADMPEVLDWERTTKLIEESEQLAVSQCYCRHKAAHLGKACDAPQEICLSLNNGAEFVIRRGFGRPINKQQALSIVTKARKIGLVQIADNVKNEPAYVCNCCACCCGQLSAINEFGLRAVNPSGFEPQHDPEECKGCSRCSRACPVAAIAMTPERTGGKRKNELYPVFDSELCIGCGVCATTCKQEAIRMERGAEPSHVPVNTIERVVRQMLERGRLADLLFDESESRGAAFLNHAVRAITHLPPAERALASEQVKSRFVSFVVENAPAIDA